MKTKTNEVKQSGTYTTVGSQQRGYEPHARLNPKNHTWYWEALKSQSPEEAPANPLEGTKQPRRWVMERLFSWLNRSRWLL